MTLQFLSWTSVVWGLVGNKQTVAGTGVGVTSEQSGEENTSKQAFD